MNHVHEYYKTCDQCQQTSNMLMQNLANWLLLYLKNDFKNGIWTSLDWTNLQVD